jgi:hypothetical protein
MNSYFNGWQMEQMVRYEMHEVDRAVEQARLLREAGLTGPSWLTRAMNGLRNLLKARRKGVQEHPSFQPRVLRKKSPRSA